MGLLQESWLAARRKIQSHIRSEAFALSSGRNSIGYGVVRGFPRKAAALVRANVLVAGGSEK
jgi:hypothetical protein